MALSQQLWQKVLVLDGILSVCEGPSTPSHYTISSGKGGVTGCTCQPACFIFDLFLFLSKSNIMSRARNRASPAALEYIGHSRQKGRES